MVSVSLARARAALAARDVGPWLIVGLCLLLLPLSVPRVALSDEVQYYAYLRSAYFDRDLDFRNEYTHFAEQGRRFGDEAVANALLREDANNPNPRTGLLRNVAPVGSAIMWAPGFVLADGYVLAANALGAGIPRDGYARPYILGVCLMTVLYTTLGLLLTYRLARRYAGDFAATTATLTVFLASPLVFYTYIAMPWSHAPGFFLFALFLSLWMRDWGRGAGRGLGTWLLLGLVGGLMVMTREQLGLLLIVPALEALSLYWGLLRGRRWATAAGLLGRHLAFLAALALAVTPQLLAYQVLNGRPAPSATVGDKFRFLELGPVSILLSPNFLNTLLDPGRGAFLWAPVIALGLVGLIWLGRRDAWLAALLLAAFLAQTYINGAFGTTWHLRRAFGFRRLIECTPIFVLGLAALIEWLRPRVGAWPILAAAALLIYWNVGLIAQWTVLRTAIRDELIWGDMLRWQLVEVPGQVAGRLWTLVFDRCRLVTNQSC
ncbi:MAG TPA: glycosyltransferase family 39 protein [Chloroflexaceae bacterium]|nr:glycosyltransferase family 39 protein [Chloroflexaceae bacterium]